MTGLLGMIFVGQERTEEVHYPVPGELINGTLVFVDLIHKDLETPVHDPLHLFRNHLFRPSGETAHVSKNTVTSFRSPSTELRLVRILPARNLGL